MSAVHENVPPTEDREVNVQAAVLAWLWPGLGHISLGHKYRGVLIMAGVLLLVVIGLLVGGLDSVDRKDDRLWFYAQAMCGPVALAADFVNQSLVKTWPEVEVSSPGRVNEMGTLFVALAGLMNFVVILDVLHFYPRPAVPLERQPRRREGERDE